MNRLIPLTAAAMLVALAACDRADVNRSAATVERSAEKSANAVERGAATVASAADDATITAKVKSALLAESGVPGTDINVDTSQGRVTLRGQVADKTQIERALSIAKGIDGVQSVDNQLTTRAG